MFLDIEFQTLLQEDVLFLLVEAVSSVILEKLEQGLKDGLKAAVQEVEEQLGQGGLKSKLDWMGLEPRLLIPCGLEKLEEFELDESLIHDLAGMFIGAELSMLALTFLIFLASSQCDCFRGCGFRPPRLLTLTPTECSRSCVARRGVERFKCLLPLATCVSCPLSWWRNPSLVLSSC